MKKLHWLPIAHRIWFEIALLTFKAISGFAPSYITYLISIKTGGGSVAEWLGRRTKLELFLGGH